MRFTAHFSCRTVLYNYSRSVTTQRVSTVSLFSFMYHMLSYTALPCTYGGAAGWFIRTRYSGWVTPSCHGNNSFGELVIWWMRWGLSGGRCDWGCVVSANGSLGDDEKGNGTAGDDFQSACMCVCLQESIPCTFTFYPSYSWWTVLIKVLGYLGIWVINIPELTCLLCNVFVCVSPPCTVTINQLLSLC